MLVDNVTTPSWWLLHTFHALVGRLLTADQKRIGDLDFTFVRLQDSGIRQIAFNGR